MTEELERIVGHKLLEMKRHLQDVFSDESRELSCMLAVMLRGEDAKSEMDPDEYRLALGNIAEGEKS